MSTSLIERLSLAIGLPVLAMLAMDQFPAPFNWIAATLAALAWLHEMGLSVWFSGLVGSSPNSQV